MKLMLGNCLDKLKELDDNSVDSVVTDPPYGLSFMGKKWDYDVPAVEIWEECFRVLKPGGHLLAFAGTRTQHRMAVNIEDAGFEIRDMIAWVYGSGFPKSHNIGKATGKEELQGWGTALKPALEPITVARKPLEEKTIAANVLKYGTGGINIDASRVEPAKTGWTPNQGRFPANLIHDGSQKVVSQFPNTKAGGSVSGKEPSRTGDENTNCYGEYDRVSWDSYADNGSAARFFYCAKASKSDRNEGLDTFKSKVPAAAEFRPNHTEKAANGEDGNPYGRWSETKNIHPTVKPTDLMKYLIRLVTPKDGVVLDPFMGSGSTGKAAKIEGFDFIGIEMDEEYFQIAQARIDAVEKPITLEDFFG